MTLGEKIRAARLEAGLSQRQLCGDTVTRNMLSQIENGSARPSMTTLQILAARLGKPISWFLEEDVVSSTEADAMEQVRRLYADGDIQGAMDALDGCSQDDSLFDQEKRLLGILLRMKLAQQACREGKAIYAATLLEQAKALGNGCIYYSELLERERLLLLADTGRESPAVLAALLPPADKELLLRAEAALMAGESADALLESCQGKNSSRWHLLRGEAFFTAKDYEAAAAHFTAAENAFPAQALPRLECCYRELGNFQKAYEYAVKQR